MGGAVGVQVIAGQGWPHGEEGKYLEGGQEASKGLKPADLELHSISNGKPWKASEQDMGNSTLGLSLLMLIHPTRMQPGFLGRRSPPHGLGSCPPGLAVPSARLPPAGYHHCPLLPDKEQLQKQER